MLRFPLRSGQSNTVIMTMLGILIVVVAAGFIYFSMALRSPTQSSSSSRSSAASSAQQTQSSSARTNGTQAEIDACINVATVAHNQLWAQTCTQVSATMKAAYNTCIANGQEPSYCQTEFGAYTSSDPACTLPLARKNVLNARFNAAKVVCQNKTY